MNYELLIIGLWVWFPVAVIAYTFREIPHIWSVSTTFRMRIKWMENSRWWTDASPRSDSWIKHLTGLNLFDDAYHFFGNLPRIFLAAVIWVSISWSLAIAAMLLWGMIRLIIIKTLIKEIEPTGRSAASSY